MRFDQSHRKANASKATFAHRLNLRSLVPGAEPAVLKALAFAVCLWLCAIPATDAGSGAVEQGWILSQYYHFLGNGTVYFTANRLKIETMTISFLVDFPKNTITISNEDNKKYCVLARSGWHKKSRLLSGDQKAGFRRVSPWKKEGNCSIAGFRATKFSRVVRFDHHDSKQELWMTQDLPFPEKGREVLWALLRISGDMPDGVPLRHNMTDVRLIGKTKKPIEYNTFTSERARIPSSKFLMPRGYTKAADEMEVFFGDQEEPSFSQFQTARGIDPSLPVVKRLQSKQ